MFNNFDQGQGRKRNRAICRARGGGQQAGAGAQISGIGLTLGAYRDQHKFGALGKPAMDMTQTAVTASEEMIPAWVDGALTPVGKLAVHQRGLRHKAVSVFVMAGTRVLIQRRALAKYHTPGLWANTCCTHPRWGEDALVCAKRRLAEELGLTGLSPVFADRVEYRADVGGGLTEHELVDIFIADATADAVVVPNPAEVMDVRWVDLATLQADVLANPDTYTPWLRIYLADHMARIFGDRTA